MLSKEALIIDLANVSEYFNDNIIIKNAIDKVLDGVTKIDIDIILHKQEATFLSAVLDKNGMIDMERLIVYAATLPLETVRGFLLNTLKAFFLGDVSGNEIGTRPLASIYFNFTKLLTFVLNSMQGMGLALSPQDWRDRDKLNKNINTESRRKILEGTLVRSIQQLRVALDPFMVALEKAGMSNSKKGFAKTLEQFRVTYISGRNAEKKNVRDLNIRKEECDALLNALKELAASPNLEPIMKNIAESTRYVLDKIKEDLSAGGPGGPGSSEGPGSTDSSPIEPKASTIFSVKFSGV